jgi:hypothetical protein
MSSRESPPARVMKNIRENPKIVQRSCTKHGAYTGPYCLQCYERAMGSDEPPVKDEKSMSD